MALTPCVTALVTNSSWPVLSAHDAGPTKSASVTLSSVGGLLRAVVRLIEHGVAGALRQEDAGERHHHPRHRTARVPADVAVASVVGAAVSRSMPTSCCRCRRRHPRVQGRQ